MIVDVADRVIEPLQRFAACVQQYDGRVEDYFEDGRYVIRADLAGVDLRGG
jgi:hypothetical protein